MVKGETYNKQLFESEAFRHFINVFTNRQSGITRGCELEYDNQNITVGKGYFFILGGLLRETTGTENEIPSEAGYYKLVYEIDLSKINTKDNFNQGSYKFVKALGDYPNLTQEDLDNEGSIYQFPFCQFKISEQGIEDFKDIREIIDYGLYEKRPVTLYENENGGLGDIVLNDSAEKFSRIKIFYSTPTRKGSVEVDPNDEKTISLPVSVTSSSTYVSVIKIINIDGENIHKVSEYEYFKNNTGRETFTETDTIQIKKVIGYKD